jgi:hypothetical protein
MAGSQPARTAHSATTGALSLACLLMCLVTGARSAPLIRGAGELPRTVLWAWQSPNDLRAIDPSTTGVAVLMRTISVSAAGVRVEPRLTPLIVPPAARVLAVVRLEVGAGVDPQPSLSEVSRASVAALTSGAIGLQIDFDALESQRPFYRQLLTDISAALP